MLGLCSTPCTPRVPYSPAVIFLPAGFVIAATMTILLLLFLEFASFADGWIGPMAGERAFILQKRMTGTRSIPPPVGLAFAALTPDPDAILPPNVLN